MANRQTTLDKILHDELLEHVVRIGLLRWTDTPVVFKSGAQSHIYVSGREELTSDRAALWCVCQAIAWKALCARDAMTNGCQRPCVIGIPTAGTPLATAAALAGVPGRDPLACRTMRTQTKSHGLHHNLIEGAPRRDEFYVTADNVLTAGTTIRTAVAGLGAEGYDTDNMAHIVLVDRQLGGAQALKRENHVVLPILTITEIVEELVTRSMWPATRLTTLLQELHGQCC